MRAIEFLIEYNMTSILNSFGDKLLNKWKAEGEPFRDQIQHDGEITADDIINWVEQYDPSRNNKYTTWLIGKYAGKKGGIERLEDIPTKAEDILTRYIGLGNKNLLKPEHAVINQIKSLNDLHDIIDTYGDKDTISNKQSTKNEEQELYDNGAAILLYNTSEYKIVIPKTEEAAIFFGRNTRWCTAAHNNNMFANYSDDGDLYMILHKPTNRRWQFHFESMQYMDEMDMDIDMNDFVSNHRKVVDVIIKHYGGIDKVLFTDMETWISMVPNLSIEQQYRAIEYDIKLIKQIQNPAEEIQLAVIRANPAYISMIKNPTKNVQLELVKNDIRYFNSIKHPTKEAQALFDANSKGLLYITEPGLTMHGFGEYITKDEYEEAGGSDSLIVEPVRPGQREEFLKSQKE